MKKSITREFYPGDEWVYFKIYLNAGCANEVLVHLKKNVINTLLRKKLIDKWFFIRYSDPDFHIRLRLHIPAPRDSRRSPSASLSGYYAGIFAGIVSRINKSLSPFTKSGLISRIQLDTYIREIERYSPLPHAIPPNPQSVTSNTTRSANSDTPQSIDSALSANSDTPQSIDSTLSAISALCLQGSMMETCETIFFQDSEMAMELIETLPNSEINYIAAATSSIDSYLSAVGLPLDSRIATVKRMLVAYMKEWNINQPINIGKVFRQHKDHIFKTIRDKSLFNRHLSPSPLLQSTPTQPSKTISPSSRLTLSTENIPITSLIHMSINRLFPRNQRLYELISYNSLLKYYEMLLHHSPHPSQ